MIIYDYYYDSLSDWIINDRVDEYTVIDKEAVYQFGDYAHLSPETIDRFITSFINTQHIRELEDNKLERLGFLPSEQEVNYINPFNFDNKITTSTPF